MGKMIGIIISQISPIKGDSINVKGKLNSQIFIIHPDGSGELELGDGVDNYYQPQWQALI